MNKLSGVLLGLLCFSSMGWANEFKVMAPDQAGSFVGKDATVCGKIDSARYSENAEGQPTQLYMGGKFPNHKFAARISGALRSSFSPPPEESVDRVACVSGRVKRAQGNRTEIEIQSIEDLVFPK